MSHPGASHKSISIADQSTPSEKARQCYAGVECEGATIERFRFEPSRIVDSTAAAEGENVGHFQDCGAVVDGHIGSYGHASIRP